MQSESSLPGSTNTGKRSTTDDAPIQNRYEFDYEDPINPGVTLSTLVTQHMTKRSVWTLCIALGALIYIHALGQLTTAWVLASAPVNPAWPWDRSKVIMGVQYGGPLSWIFGTLVFSRLADVHSRLASSAIALLLFILGMTVPYCIIPKLVAAASNVSTVATGIIFHRIGTSGIKILITLTIADCTSLRWRGFALSWTYFPFVINMWVAPRISNNVNWRWAYGMFVIMIPAICVPALVILFLTGSRQTANITKPSRTRLSQGLMKMDPLGLLLFTTGFGLTVYGLGYWWDSETARSSRIMLSIGLVLLFPCFLTWELLYAPFPLITRDTVSTRAVKCAILATFCYQLASSLSSYSSSRLIVGGEWTVSLMTWVFNAPSLAYAVFAPIFGVIFLLTRHYKLPLLIASGLLVLGAGLVIQCARVSNPPDSLPSVGLIFAALIIIGIGGIGTELGLAVVSQASVSHDNLANVIMLMNVVYSLGDIISQPVSDALEYYSTASEHASKVIVATLVLTFALFNFAFSLPMPDYVLGPDHNAVESGGVRPSDPEEAGLTA